MLLAAVVICDCSWLALGVPVPVRFTHAAVLFPTFEFVELLMNVTTVPQPFDVGPLNGPSHSPMGNSQVSGGGVAGGFAIAIACADTPSVEKPSRRRNEVGMLVW